MFWANDFELRKANISSEGNIGYETWLTSPTLSHFTDNNGYGFLILTSVPFFPPVLNISLRLLWPVCVCGGEDKVTKSLCVSKSLFRHVHMGVFMPVGARGHLCLSFLRPYISWVLWFRVWMLFCFVLRQDLSQTETLQTSQVGQDQGRCLHHPGFGLQLYCITPGYLT